MITSLFLLLHFSTKAHNDLAPRKRLYILVIRVCMIFIKFKYIAPEPFLDVIILFKKVSNRNESIDHTIFPISRL